MFEWSVRDIQMEISIPKHHHILQGRAVRRGKGCVEDDL